VEKLEKYISDLLRKHDCVVVPGFGGFVLNAKKAHFESTGSNELLPPGKHVSFNRSLFNNDGLLYHYVAQVTGQSFDGAESFVTTQSNYWKLQLLNKKPITLEGIGSLSADVEGRWVFTPGNIVFSKAGYGLESLKLTPLEVAPSIRIQPPVKKELDPARIKGRRVWLRRTVGSLAVACLLLTGGYFFGPQLGEMSQLATFNLFEKPIENKKAEAVRSAPKTFAEPIRQPAIENELVAAPEAETTLTAQKFYVIGGSFSKEKNAIRFQSELKQKGFEAEILHNGNGFFRVAYGNNPDSLVASADLHRIQSEENKAAWILKW
jgi:hypothetical protein